MRPILYADDLDSGFDDWSAEWIPAKTETLHALARILPKRCDCECHRSFEDAWRLHAESVQGDGYAVQIKCPTCDGRGWLYPETQSITISGVEVSKRMLLLVWDMMGILE